MDYFDDRRQEGELRLIDIVEPVGNNFPRNEPLREKGDQEEYVEPFRLRHFQNIINIFEGEQEELLRERGKLFRDYERLGHQVFYLEEQIVGNDKRLREVERKIIEAYGEIKKMTRDL